MENKSIAVKIIFEKVCLIVPIEQRRFFNYLNDTLIELLMTYSNYIYCDETTREQFEPVKNLDETINVYPLYINSIVDNILFISGMGDGYKSEFLRKSKLAHSDVKKTSLKGKVIKRGRW